MNAWKIYRDGLLWSVEAVDAVEAVMQASDGARKRNLGEVWEAEENGTPLRALSTSEPAKDTPPVDSLGARYVEVWKSWGAVVARLEVYDTDEPRTLVVRRADALDVQDVSEVALRCSVRLSAALETRRVLVSVSLYRSGAKRGLPRFTRKHDTEFRQRVQAAIAANTARALAVDEARCELHRTLAALTHAGLDVEELDSLALSDLDCELVKVRKIAERELVSWHGVDGETRSKVLAALDDFDRKISVTMHVLTSGFGEGTHCVVQPSPWAPETDTEQLSYSGPGTVTGVHLSPAERYVQLDNGPEICVLLERLK